MSEASTKPIQTLPRRTQIVVRFCFALGAPLFVLGCYELLAGTHLTGLLLVIVGGTLGLNALAIARHNASAVRGGQLLCGIILIGALVINIASGGRAIGVLIMIPVLATLFVLILDGWVVPVFLAIALGQIPLAWWMGSIDANWPLAPDPTWVATAIFRVTFVAGFIAFLMGAAYRRLMSHFNEAAQVALDQWCEQAAVGQRAAARLKQFADVSADVLWETDPTLRFSFFSEGFDSVFEVRRSACIGLTPAEAYLQFSGLDNDAIDVDIFMEPLRQRKRFDDQIMLWRVAGNRVKRISYSARPVFDEQGEFLGYRGVMHDVTAELLAQRKLEIQAERDQLTQLLTRQKFFELARKELESARGLGQPAAIAFIDLDDFKTVNDRGGHELGDDLLSRIASSLRSACPDQLVGRLGGDEFVVCAFGANTKALAPELQQFSQELKQTEVIARGNVLRVGASIGIYGESPVTDATLETWLHNADLAAYEQKRKQPRSDANAKRIDKPEKGGANQTES